MYVCWAGGIGWRSISGTGSPVDGIRLAVYTGRCGCDTLGVGVFPGRCGKGCTPLRTFINVLSFISFISLLHVCTRSSPSFAGPRHTVKCMRVLTSKKKKKGFILWYYQVWDWGFAMHSIKEVCYYYHSPKFGPAWAMLIGRLCYYRVC